MFATSQSTTPVPAIVNDSHILYHVCLSIMYRRFYLLGPHKKLPPHLSYSCKETEAEKADTMIVMNSMRAYGTLIPLWGFHAC